MKKISKIGLIGAISAIFLISISIYTIPVQYANAISITKYPTGQDPRGIATFGNYIYVATPDTNDQVRVFDKNTKALVTFFTCTDCAFFIQVGDALFAYSSTGGKITRINTVGNYAVESINACGGTVELYTDGTYIYCPINASDRIDRVTLTLGAMSVVTGGNINTGVNACDGPSGLVIATNIDTMFIECNLSTNKVISLSPISRFQSGGEPNFSINLTNLGSGGMAFDPSSNHLIITGSNLSTMRGLTYSTSTGFTLTDADISGANDTTGPFGMIYDSIHRWFVGALSGSSIIVIDSTNFDVLVNLSTSNICGFGVISQIWNDDNYNFYVNGDNTSQDCFILFNASGIVNGGSDGQTSIPNTGGIDCSLPANFNILVCRLQTINQSPLKSASELTSQSIQNLFVQIGLIDKTNTDIKSNGVGYFITIIGFGILTSIFWIASKGNIQSIPTFVWLISTIALLGAMTALQYIDPTFLVIGVIAIVALAVAKTKSSIFGDSFGSGGFSGEG